MLGVNTFVCVILDQHKGIKAALKPEYGCEEGKFVHMYCMQHVANNLVQACGKDKWLNTTKGLQRNQKGLQRWQTDRKANLILETNIIIY